MSLQYVNSIKLDMETWGWGEGQFVSGQAPMSHMISDRVGRCKCNR